MTELVRVLQNVCRILVQLHLGGEPRMENVHLRYLKEFRGEEHTVAIALSPATPAPMTKTLQGGICIVVD